jgi:hypothetical protein
MTFKDLSLNAEQVGILSALGSMVSKGVMSFSDAASYGSMALLKDINNTLDPIALDKLLDMGLRIIEAAAFSHEDIHPKKIKKSQQDAASPDRAALMHAISGRNAAVWSSSDQIVFDSDLYIGKRKITFFVKLSIDQVSISDGGQVFESCKTDNDGHLKEDEILNGLRSSLDKNGFYLDEEKHIKAIYDLSSRAYNPFILEVRSMISDYLDGMSKSIISYKQYSSSRFSTSSRIEP